MGHSELTGLLGGLGAAPSAADVESIRREVERVGASLARERTLFDAVVNASPHGIIVCDAEGRLVLQNPAAERIWAGSATVGSIAGWEQYRAFHPDGRPYQATDWSMARCLSHGESVAAEEIHIQRFDNTFGVLLGSSAPLRGPEGQLQGAVAVFVDITTFRRAEERMALIADALPVLVSYVDASQHYRFINRTYERWFGQPADSVLGRSVREVLGETIYEKIRGPIERALAGETVRFEARALLPLLGERELEVTFTPDFALDGTVHGTVDLVTDVTDRRRLEAAGEQDRRHLELVAARLDLLATVSRAFALAESNLSVLLQTVVEQVVERFGDTAGITLRTVGGRIHRTEGALTPPVFFDRDPKVRQSLREAAGAAAATAAWPDGDVARTIVDTNRAWLIPRVDFAPASQASSPAPSQASSPSFSATIPFHGWLAGASVRSVLAVPIRFGERVIGVIGCTRREPSAPFTEDDQALLQQVADRAAISIENARLVDQLNEANAETDLLYELTDAVNRAESLDGVYAPALSAISRQARIPRCALLLFDPDGVIRFKAWRGLSDDYRRAVEGHSPWRHDESNATAFVVADVREAPELASLLPAFESERIRALAFIPLTHGGRLLGKFMLYSEAPRAFLVAEIRLAQTIADQVAAAVVRKQTKAERERLIEDLTRTVKLNELFTGILGHDLRNPLGAILMSAKVLSGKVKEEALGRTVGRILSAGQRMNRMITQLLDFTRVRTGGVLPIERARADVAGVFRQAIDELAEVAVSRPVRLEQQGDTRGWWDADRLAQVASNLIGNAVRHGIADGGVGVDVRIDGRDPAGITVEVSNGGAIPEELLPVIFEPFRRGELGDRRGGLGLGLFITREIVTAHQGSLDVACAADTTTFTVRLPRGAAAAALTR